MLGLTFQSKISIFEGKTFELGDFVLSFGNIVKDDQVSKDILTKLEFKPLNKVTNENYTIYEAICRDFFKSVHEELYTKASIG